MLAKVDKLPEGLTPSASKVMMTGSHGNNHAFDRGTLYFRKEGDYVFGYLDAKDTTLLHPEHQDETGGAKIEDGIYELRKQNEFTPEGLVPVQD